MGGGDGGGCSTSLWLMTCEGLGAPLYPPPLWPHCAAAPWPCATLSAGPMLPLHAAAGPCALRTAASCRGSRRSQPPPAPCRDKRQGCAVCQTMEHDPKDVVPLGDSNYITE